MPSNVTQNNDQIAFHKSVGQRSISFAEIEEYGAAWDDEVFSFMVTRADSESGSVSEFISALSALSDCPKRQKLLFNRIKNPWCCFSIEEMEELIYCLPEDIVRTFLDRHLNQAENLSYKAVRDYMDALRGNPDWVLEDAMRNQKFMSSLNGATLVEMVEDGVNDPLIERLLQQGVCLSFQEALALREMTLISDEPLLNALKDSPTPDECIAFADIALEADTPLVLSKRLKAENKQLNWNQLLAFAEFEDPRVVDVLLDDELERDMDFQKASDLCNWISWDDQLVSRIIEHCHCSEADRKELAAEYLWE